MNRQEYYECQGCGQVVQGFNAMQQIDCCNSPCFIQVYGPLDEGHIGAQETKYGSVAIYATDLEPLVAA